MEHSIDSSFSLSSKKILVTGAAGHLGRELSAALARSSAEVFLVDRVGTGLGELARDLQEQFGVSVHPYEIDLEDSAARESLALALSRDTPLLDGIVHNAAFVGTTDLDGWAVEFSKQSVETWRRALEVNVTAPFHLTQLLLPALQASPLASIVAIASLYGVVGPDWSLYEGTDMGSPAAYSVSKAGLIHLTRWLAATLGPEIRCNSVSPGGIARGQDSDFVSRYEKKTRMGRLGSEADFIGAIVFLLSDASQYMTGQNVVIDGGYSIV